MLFFCFDILGKKVCAGHIRDAELSWEGDALKQGDTKKEDEGYTIFFFY